MDSEFLELDSGLCLPDSSHWWESRFLELYSGFPKENVLRFLIPQQAKIPRIPQSGFLKWSDWYKYNQSLKKTHTTTTTTTTTTTRTTRTTATTKTTKKINQ